LPPRWGRSCSWYVPGEIPGLLRPCGDAAGHAREGWMLPPEERHLLEPQAGQDLLHPRVGERPDPLPQAGLVDR
jgi:hypothetical protein